MSNCCHTSVQHVIRPDVTRACSAFLVSLTDITKGRSSNDHCI